MSLIRRWKMYGKIFHGAVNGAIDGAIHGAIRACVTDMRESLGIRSQDSWTGMPPDAGLLPHAERAKFRPDVQAALDRRCAALKKEGKP